MENNESLNNSAVDQIQPVEQVQQAEQTAPVEQAQDSAQGQQRYTIELTEEQAKFFGANGSPDKLTDKMFDRIKNIVSNPQPKPAQTQNVEQKPVEQPQNVLQNQQRQIPKGYITPEEYMTEQYFKSLSNEEKYKSIADQIRSGEVLKEMAEFGIKPTQDGMFNDGQIRKFLDLKAQTVPAQATTAPVTNTPTVEWSPVDKVESFEMAQKIIQENIGRPGMEHPKTAEAKEFLKGFYKK